jgi:hypothetical protein
MDELIKRLEAATGSDRELDNLIALAAGYTIAQKCMPNAPDTYSTPKRKYIGVAPRFTESIDAALTLVPDGWTRAVDATAPEMGIDVTLFPPDDTAEVCETHDSEAVATCMSALRARARPASPGDGSTGGRG